jgi:hypothetical protein
VWRESEVGQAARRLIEIRVARRQAEEFAEATRGRMRRSWKREARDLARAQPEAEADFEELAVPQRSRLEEACEALTAKEQQLLEQRAARERWLYQHPEVDLRLRAIERELGVLNRVTDICEAPNANMQSIALQRLNLPRCLASERPVERDVDMTSGELRRGPGCNIRKPRGIFCARS